MSKILVISDTHGKSENFRRLLVREKDIDFLIHLGDIEGGEDELRRMLAAEHPLAGFVRVTGNCDEEIGEAFRIFEWDGVRLFLTHGHRFGVRPGRLPEALFAAARKENCACALFGHTHVPYMEEKDGLILFNPGSLSKPRQEGRLASYGVITTAEGKIVSHEQRYL